MSTITNMDNIYDYMNKVMEIYIVGHSNLEILT